jgi:hypothetical protein
VNSFMSDDARTTLLLDPDLIKCELRSQKLQVESMEVQVRVLGANTDEVAAEPLIHVVAVTQHQTEAEEFVVLKHI